MFTELMKTQDTSITLRKANDRGRGELSWLSSRFTFSFAEYMDQAHMGYSSLRVINDDVIQPGGGFGMHPHHSMEIFAYVLNMAKNGDHYWVLAHVTPSLDGTGAIVGYHSNRRRPRPEAVASVADYRECPRLDAPATPERVLMAVERLRGDK